MDLLKLTEGLRLTRLSNKSACACVCTANCPTPSRTPSHSSQFSPRQQCSFTSATTFNTLVNRDKSACPSSSSPERRRENDVPDRIDDAEDTSDRTGREDVGNSEATDAGEPGRGGRRREEKSGKAKLRRRPEGIRTAAASRLLMVRSARMHILCHCSISGGIFCRTTLLFHAKSVNYQY